MGNNKKILLFLSGILITIVSLFMVSPGSSEKNQKNELLATVERRDFKIELNVVGVLDAAKSHMIASELIGANGTIIYLIDDGKKVRKGELLVRFDQAPFKKEVDRLEAEVESYKAAVLAAEQVVAFEENQVKREITNAEYVHRVAALELRRLEEGEGPLQLSTLYEEKQKVIVELKRYQSFYADLKELQKKGFENPSEISSTKEQIEVLKTKLASVTKRFESYSKHVLPALIESAKEKLQNGSLILQQTKQGGKHKVAKTNAALIQIQGALKTKEVSLDKAKFELAKTEIRAPFAGLVIHYKTFRHGKKRKPREGDFVFKNQPILYLPDIAKMIVNTKAREVDLHKIKLGQQGRIITDAYPDTILSGELIFIGALATSEDSGKSLEKYFQVTFNVNEEDRRLRPGMTCRVSIQAESVKNVIAVPVQAVFTEDTKTVCYIKKRMGGIETREVTLGKQNEDFIEITKGLQVGEKVSLVKQPL